MESESIVYLPDSVTNSLPLMVKHELAEMSAQKQMEFAEEYQRKSKSIVTAYFLIFLFGFHYVYIKKWGLMLLFIFTWGGYFIWFIVDFFRIRNLIKDYNRDVAIEIMLNLKIMSN